MDKEEFRKRAKGSGEYIDISDQIDLQNVVYVFQTEQVQLHLGVGSSGQIPENGDGKISKRGSRKTLSKDGVCAITQNAIHTVDSGNSTWTFPLKSIDSFGSNMSNYRKEGKTLIRRKEKVKEKCKFSLSFLLGGRLHEIKSVKYEDYEEGANAQYAINFIRSEVLSQPEYREVMDGR